MIRALYTAASGMSAQQANLDTVANNLANSATAGFRRRRLQFEDMIYQNMITPGSPQSQQTTAAGLQIGLGTRSAATEVVMTQGDYNQTSNTYDVAIQGNGFFQITRPDGTIAYTRAGNFHPTNQGVIVTSDGDPIVPSITVPANAQNVMIRRTEWSRELFPGSRPRRSSEPFNLRTSPIQAVCCRWEEISSRRRTLPEFRSRTRPAEIPEWEPCSRGISKARTWMLSPSLCR